MQADLDRLDQMIRDRAPFDVSPRGIRFRPDEELSAQLRTLAARGEQAVPALQARLEGADPFGAIAWLTALTWMDAPAAGAAVDAYARRLERADPWEGTFPGAREVLLYLGRPVG